MPPDYLALFKERLQKITKDTRVALLPDTDGDGLCSAVIAAKSIERFRGRPVDSIIFQAHKNIGIQEETVKQLRNEGIQVLIALDKAVDEEPDTLAQARKHFEIIVFDHHQFKMDRTDDRVLIIKSQAISKLDGAQYPTTKLVWDCFEPYVDLKDADWICASGIISDGGYVVWKEFVDKVFENHKIPKNPDVFETDLGLVARIISNAILVDTKNTKKAFQILNTAKDQNEVLNHPIREFDSKINAELNLWIGEHKKRALFFPDKELIIYVVSPRYPINSPLSTILSHKFYPNQTVVLVHDSGDSILSTSFRRQDYKVDCPALVKACVEGLKDALGGGHIPAAGGKIRREDLPIFLERLKSLAGDKRFRLDPKTSPKTPVHID